jgi:hydroxymethylpyrimidine pyrophosphatase-like HAD family hydrolase
MKAAFAFDIDNTLTPPRRPLQLEMAQALRELAVPFVLAAGSDVPLLEDQFFRPFHDFGFRGEFDAFVCNGATRYRCRYTAAGFELDLTDDFALHDYLGADYDRLKQILRRLLDAKEFELPPHLNVLGDQIVERGSMVNFAPIGRPRTTINEQEMENRERFVPFDRESGYRARLLAELRQAVQVELPERPLFVTLGGQTSFDIGLRGRDKSFAVRCLFDEGCERVTYVGDALFPGGNDAAVLDFKDNLGPRADTLTVIQVDGWEQTLALLRKG